MLLGSTAKMGAGTNVQKKLVALHHLDCPWRPADLQQREGRIIRQGNENKEVEIYTYVTENTFDSYLYQLVESKQKFIGQIMTSKSLSGLPMTLTKRPSAMRRSRPCVPAIPISRRRWIWTLTWGGLSC